MGIEETNNEIESTEKLSDSGNVEDSGGFISQDEIDAMMGFESSHKEKTQEPVLSASDESILKNEAKQSVTGSDKTISISSLDILNQDRITRSRMPTMEVLNDRFARSFRVSLFNYLRVNADILPISAQMQRYGEYIGKIPLPSYFVMVSMAPLRGSMLFVMDPYLCYAVIEAFFGGNGKLEPKIEGRDFSIIEQRVFNKIIEHAVVDFSSAWEPIVKFRMKILRADMKAQFVSIASGPETVVGSSFDIEMDRWKGHFYTCFPYNSVEPFREQLVSGVAADQSEMDPTWKTTLHKDVQNAKVDVSALLAVKDIPFNQAQTLQIGDIITFDRIHHAKVYVENILIGEGTYGVSRNHYATRLTEYRSLNEDDVLKLLQIKREGIDDVE